MKESDSVTDVSTSEPESSSKTDIPASQSQASGPKTDMPTSQAKDFMLEQYKALSDSFWRNEELGERRINFLITLVTAVLTAMVALVKVGGLDLEDFLLPSILVVIALLSLGVVTFRRMLRRNRVTDEYKRGMEIIRDWFEREDDSLKGHRPFPKSLLFLLDCEPRVPGESEREVDEVLEKLRVRLAREGDPLGDEARGREIKVGRKWVVCREGEYNRWLVWRKRRIYLVREVKGKLAVYRPRTPSWGGLAEMVGVMNSLFAGALVFFLILGGAQVATWIIGALAHCDLKLNAVSIGCALVAGFLGMVGAIIVQGHWMIRYYEEYDITVPRGDS